MRQRLFFILFITFFTTSLQAQIQRKFLGFELGNTRTEIKNHFKSNGSKIIKDDSEGFVIAGKEFAGITWMEVHFMFIKDKFYSVVFCNGDETDKDGVFKLTKEYIDRSLSEKYPQYQKKDPRTNKTFFFDGVTRIDTEYEYHEGKWLMYLQYIDYKILLKHIEETKSDL